MLTRSRPINLPFSRTVTATPVQRFVCDQLSHIPILFHRPSRLQEEGGNHMKQTL